MRLWRRGILRYGDSRKGSCLLGDVVLGNVADGPSGATG